MAKEDKGKANYRMEAWMRAAIKDIADQTDTTETQVVVEILKGKLEALGYKSPLNAMLAAPLTKKDKSSESSARVAGE